MKYTCVCGFTTDDVDMYIKHKRFYETLFAKKYNEIHAHMDAIKEKVRLERENSNSN